MGTSDLPARQVVEELLRLLLAKDMQGFADLWAEDGVIEFPFAALHFPESVEGRENVREYMAHYPDMLDVREITSSTIHDTVDGDVAIIEFEVDGVVVATGRPYHAGYIAVITTRDGEIVRYRDYWSPLMAIEALGGPDAVRDAVATTAGGTA